MIKICFVVTLYITYKSFLREFSEYLHKQGNYEISLICNDEEEIKKDLPEYVKYYPINIKRGVSLSIFKTQRQIKKIIKENRFDIVQYSTPNAAFCASIASKKAKTPVRLYCQWGIRYMGFSGLKRAIFKQIERATCKNSTIIEAESHNIREFSISEKLYSKDRSCVVWNGSASGVNLTKFNVQKKEEWRKENRKGFGFSDEDIVFIFAARLTADKGVNELLEAFCEIEKEYKNAKLLVVGGEDDINSINLELLAKAKESKNVIFTGRVENIEEYYSCSDVFVAPSYREGFGLVVIEAAAMGLPAIVSNVPGQVDAIDVDKTGILCQVKNATSLRDAMKKMLVESKMREQMGNYAITYAKENYEQQALFERLSDARKNLVNGKGE